MHNLQNNMYKTKYDHNNDIMYKSKHFTFFCKINSFKARGSFL